MKVNVVNVVVYIFILIYTASAISVGICDDWNRIIDGLFIINNSSDSSHSSNQSVCPAPGPLTELQTAVSFAYSKLEGRSSYCSLLEFAGLLYQGGWHQPMWLVVGNDKEKYNRTIASIIDKDGVTWGVNINFPTSTSGYFKHIEGDGWLDTTGKLHIISKINVTRCELYVPANP